MKNAIHHRHCEKFLQHLPVGETGSKRISWQSHKPEPGCLPDTFVPALIRLPRRSHAIAYRTPRNDGHISGLGLDDGDTIQNKGNKKY
jgi:hypothetical protein